MIKDNLVFELTLTGNTMDKVIVAVRKFFESQDELELDAFCDLVKQAYHQSIRHNTRVRFEIRAVEV